MKKKPHLATKHFKEDRHGELCEFASGGGADGEKLILLGNRVLP